MSEKLFFYANNGTLGFEPHVLDEDDQFALLGDLEPGSDPSYIHSTAALGQIVTFLTSTEGTDDTIFATDGTSAGTIPLDPTRDFEVDDDVDLVESNGRVYFVAESESDNTGEELYVTDGTPPGTNLVIDLYPGGFDANPDYLASFGDGILFRGRNATSGNELFYSDGTEAGTRIVADINDGTSSSSPVLEEGGLFGDRYLFSAFESAGVGRELFVTDGTDAGTERVRDIFSGPGNSDPAEFLALNNVMLFSATNGSNGRELWRSDGTTNGTILLKDIFDGSSSSSPQGLVRFGDGALFSADNGSDGRELWYSDGTTSGTAQVLDIRNGSFGSVPEDITPFGDGSQAIFSARNGSAGRELWITDGTTVGTRLLKDINPGSGDSDPSQFFEFDGEVYFIAYTEVTGTPLGYELWKTDGTQDGTVLVRDFNPGSGSGFGDEPDDEDSPYFTILNVNSAPEITGFSIGEVPRNAGPGTAVGVIQAIDADGDPLTYTLIEDAGGLLSLDGAILESTGSLGGETTLTVTVEVTDPSGATDVETFDIEVTEAGVGDDDDVVAGDDGPDLLQGFGGDDRLEGNGGDDTLEGGDGDDGLIGGDGDDKIDGGSGNDNIASGDGDDTAEGGSGDDFMGGGLGDDNLSGGTGNDTIGGGQGEDEIDGGDGDDVVAGGAANDTIRGGEGDDTMGASFGDDSVSGGGGADSLGGGTGRDVIAAGDGADSVGGGEGDDTITGGSGNDFLAGGGRNDLIDGGGGNDSINAGGGNDTITGGTGADLFIFNGEDPGATDRITDFEDGTDRIRLFGVDNAPGTGLEGKVDALEIVDTPGGASFNYDGQTVILAGVAAGTLGVDDFVFV